MIILFHNEQYEGPKKLRNSGFNCQGWTSLILKHLTEVVIMISIQFNPIIYLKP